MKTHFWKGDVMLKFNSIIVLIALIVALPSSLTANTAVWTPNGYEMNWTSGDLEISSTQWSTIDQLQTYNDVTVKMYGGGTSILYVR